MKTWTSNTLLFLLLFFSMSPAFSGDFETRALIDKSYARDNSYCTIGKVKVELEIRGLDQYTSPRDAGYGEHIFIVKNGKRTLLPLNKNLIGRYRLLKGKQNNCTKSLMIQFNSRTIFFFLKDSRPLLDTLSAVVYSADTNKAEVVETNFGVHKAMVEKNQLKFSSAPSIDPLGGGTVKIFNKEFIYVKKRLIPWYLYDGKSFVVDPETTFNDFEFKAFFKDFSDFANSFVWDKSEKHFKIQEFRHAVRHSTKERCLSIGSTSTNWKCK